MGARLFEGTFLYWFQVLPQTGKIRARPLSKAVTEPEIQVPCLVLGRVISQ